MSDVTFWSIFGALVGGLALLLYGPRRSDLWRAVEHWGGDNRRAALKRERRRALRKEVEHRQPETDGTLAREAFPQTGGREQ